MPEMNIYTSKPESSECCDAIALIFRKRLFVAHNCFVTNACNAMQNVFIIRKLINWNQIYSIRCASKSSQYLGQQRIFVCLVLCTLYAEWKELLRHLLHKNESICGPCDERKNKSKRKPICELNGDEAIILGGNELCAAYIK